MLLFRRLPYGVVERASNAGALENHAHLLLRPLRYAVFKVRRNEAQLLQPVVRVRRAKEGVCP